jgi:hypothetical protein
MHQSDTVIWISINEKPPPMERMFACIAHTIYVLRYCKGPPQQSHSDYWRDSFGAKTNINRIEDVIAWLGLFIYPLANSRSMRAPRSVWHPWHRDRKVKANAQYASPGD